MSEDVAARLRVLARDHYEGRLSLEAYRGLRRPLLDSLISGGLDEPSVITQPRTAVRPAPATSPASAAPLSQPPQVAPVVAAAVRAAPPTSAPEPSSAGGTGRGVRVAVAVVVALGVLAGAGFLYFRSTQPGTSPSGAAPTPSAPASEVYALIEPLLESEDWSESRLTDTNAALLKAGSPALAAAAGTEWFQRFTDAVRRRLKEQQALAPTGSVPETGALARLALTIGLDLKAPDSPIRIVSAVEPERAVATPEKAAAEAQAAASTTPAPHAAPAAVATRNASVAPATHAGSATPVSRPPPPAPASAPAAAATPAAAAPATAPAATACRAELGGTRRPYCQDVLGGSDLGPQLAVVPTGAFEMGNADVASERPVHHVTISKSFAVSVQEVSQSEFRLFCERTGRACPAQPWSGDDYPVVQVSWADAHAYTEWLSKASGHAYRLPSEAEWEYAARAGHTGPFPSGDSLSPMDVYYSATSTLTSPAPRSKHFNANDWHLLNMVGNVREWVEDTWSPSLEGAPADGSARTDHDAQLGVVRGGAYADLRQKLRLSTREPLSRDTRDALTGIRLVRVID